MADSTPQPYKVIIMRQDDWVAFRWQIAVDIINVIGPANADLVKQAVSNLRDADSKTTIEWRTE